jgi:hypothetical protein
MTTDTQTRDITKADVDTFLFGKHLTSCAVCGRFRSKCDLDVHTLSCNRGATADCSSSSTLNVLMIVCHNCGAIEFHDRTIIAKWLDSQRVTQVV